MFSSNLSTLASVNAEWISMATIKRPDLLKPNRMRILLLAPSAAIRIFLRLERSAITPAGQNLCRRTAKSSLLISALEDAATVRER